MDPMSGKNGGRKKPTQELLPQVPKGYRRVTPEENEELREQSTQFQILSARIGQHSAEQEAARLKLSNAMRELNIVKVQIDQTNARLGIKDPKKDMIEVSNVIYVRTADAPKGEPKAGGEPTKE